MVKNILPGSVSTGDSMSPLIPFDMIFDTDVGLLSLIFKSYMDPKIFNKSFFVGKTVNELAHVLYDRSMRNPLYLCVNNDYTNSCDSLYNEFMETKYSEILNLSVITEFYRLVGAFNNESDIRTTIVCKRQEEIDLLKQYHNTERAKFVLSSTMSETDIKKHNQFYFKDVEDAAPYATLLKGKTIYFANYGFNRNEMGDLVDNPIVPVLNASNVINLIEVYKFKKKEEEDEEDDSNN
jgi:hypothetical protein